MSTRSRSKAVIRDVTPGAAPGAVAGEAYALLRGSLDETLRAIARTAQTALGADRATCYVISEKERCNGVFTTETDPRRRRDLERTLGADVGGLPIWQLLVENTDPLLVIEDIAAAAIGGELRSRLGAGALMGVRLEHESVEHEGESEFLGAVFVRFHEPRAIGPAERAAARGLANLAALAIANARLRDRAMAHLAVAQRRADTDELTGLPNRRGLEARFGAALAEARTGDGTLSVLVLDLDNFKTLNDSHGYPAGDAALRLVARTLEAELRPGDIVARMGGEQFVVVLPGTGSRGAWLVAERMRVALRSLGAGAWLLPTASIGIASSPAHGTEPRDLLRAADSAMYDAKRLGRDRSIVFEPTAARARSARMALAQEENQDHLASVIALAEALDARDPSTHAHSRTVGGFAARIADRLGLSGERVEEVRVAGLLHDIGKVGVPDAILHKRGPLLDSEWRHVRRHPEVGSAILIHRKMDEIREWVLRHHERPDGRGYPGKLMGDAIPVEARILAVADAYEAMISDRPYRKGMSPADAQAELGRCRGTQFDGAVVDAFLGALRDDAA